jgi:hypothetical protein
MEQNGQHKVNRDEGLGFKKMHIYLKEQKKKKDTYCMLLSELCTL